MTAAGGDDARPLVMAAWTAPSHWRTRPAQKVGLVMRALRLSLVGTVILSLAGGLSVGVHGTGVGRGR